MAKRDLTSVKFEENPKPSAPSKDNTNGVGNPAHALNEGRAMMNMHATISPPANHTVAKAAKYQRLYFYDDKGRPSERSGPDLRKATPINEVIADLERRRSLHARAFCDACNASGIDLSVMYSRDGEEGLMMGYPFDNQEKLRKPRYDALVRHLKSRPSRRQAVIDLLNNLGRFVDNRPFSSVEEAAEIFVSAGGRIYVLPDERCEETMPIQEDTFLREMMDGYPLRRLRDRYQSTLRQRGARDAMKQIVLRRGSVLPQSGAVILEKEARQ